MRGISLAGEKKNMGLREYLLRVNFWGTPQTLCRQFWYQKAYLMLQQQSPTSENYLFTFNGK